MKRRLSALIVTTFLIILLVFVHIANQPLKNNENLQTQTYKFLVNNGFTPIQASGIMSSIAVSSDFNCNATDPSNIGYGLLQWSFCRKDHLENFTAEIGKPIDDLETQLLFLIEELDPKSRYYQLLPSYKGYERSDFLQASTPRQAVESFCILYERPYKANLKLRGDIAQEFYEIYNN